MHGFATSFEDGALPAVLDWLRELRCTVVQIYDWMSEYTEPLGPEQGWRDSVRAVGLVPKLCVLLRRGSAGGRCGPRLRTGVRGRPNFAAEHPEMLLYQGDGTVQRFFDMSEACEPGQQGVAGALCRCLRFGGRPGSVSTASIIDTYGYPRAALDRAVKPSTCASPTKSSWPPSGRRGPQTRSVSTK